MGIRDLCRKKIGIRDTAGKNCRDTGYLKRKYGDTQRKVQGYKTAQLGGYGIFQEKVKRCLQGDLLYLVYRNLCRTRVGQVTGSKVVPANYFFTKMDSSHESTCRRDKAPGIVFLCLLAANAGKERIYDWI